ncbi:MAG: DNA mismatch repair endonuclease MutL, partial [Saprospiraceae bacterium]
RPASVVKELIENAIDAGSTSIKLVVKDAGKSLIQVIDNGCGMSETDARMCFERHATSKIRESKDLFSIRTMGFRGEAMASIAAIAHVELRTKREMDEMGTEILIEGSKLTSHEPCQSATGTKISVKNLFFNVPARRNFLKSSAVEMRHIIDEFQRVAMAHPDIFFSLHHNGTELFHLSAGNLRQRIVGLLGQHVNKKLVPVHEDTDILTIKGYVGKAEYAKKTRGEQFFFVNDRFIKSGYLNHAVMGAFEDLIPKGSYPLYVLFFEMDPRKLDINIHPTKQEIKFEDERLVYNYLKVTVRHALAQYNVTPTLDFDADPTFIPQTPKYPQEEKTSSPAKKTSYSSGKISNEHTIRQRNNLKNWQ